jgi:hypothetical protein
MLLYWQLGKYLNYILIKIGRRLYFFILTASLLLGRRFAAPAFLRITFKLSNISMTRDFVLQVFERDKFGIFYLLFPLNILLEYFRFRCELYSARRKFLTIPSWVLSDPSPGISNHCLFLKFGVVFF